MGGLWRALETPRAVILGDVLTLLCGSSLGVCGGQDYAGHGPSVSQIASSSTRSSVAARELDDVATVEERLDAFFGKGQFKSLKGFVVGIEEGVPDR